MGHIERQFVLTPRPPVGEQGLLLGKRFGLDEQLVEGRMLAVRIVRRHGEFNIAGEA